MCKQMSFDSFKVNVTDKIFIYKSDIFNIYEEDLALNNLQGSIYYKTKTKPNHI